MKCKVIKCMEQAVFSDGYCREHHKEVERMSLFNFEKDKELKKASDSSDNTNI